MAEKGSILVVDDEIGPRESLRMILKPIYDVYTAANGQEALSYLSNRKIDLVTLDLKMPGIPGIDLLKEIKRIRTDVEVIIITGYGTLTNAQEAIRYGAFDFISKPFNVPEIISIVGKSVEKRNFNLKIKGLTEKIRSLRCHGKGFSAQASGRFPQDEELERELNESLRQLEKLRHQQVSVNYLDFLKVLIYILESKEPYTSGHSERVALYSELIGKDLCLPPEDKENLQIASLLHDIGKISFRQHPFENGVEHLSQLNQHPVMGVDLIKPLGFHPSVISAILHHHERWDGQGSPDGLAGHRIPLLARIIALADAYDSMTSESRAGAPFPARKIQEEMEKNRGVRFDPEIVSLFLKHFRQGGIGPSGRPSTSLH